jgi:hypothetical protein
LQSNGEKTRVRKPRAYTREETRVRLPEATRADLALVAVRGLVGTSGRFVHPERASGPAYTLSPEPMTDSPILDAQKRPRSVWSALLTLDPKMYRELVCLAFGCTRAESRGVLVDSLLHEAVRARRHEAGPDGCWLVWIDRQGRAKVQVYP